MVSVPEIFNTCKGSNLWILSCVALSLVAVSSTQGVPPGCDGDMDLIFLMDSSESIIENDPFGKPYHNWQILKNFTKDVVKRLPVDNGDTAVGVIQYASKVINNFDLGRYQRVSEIREEIDKVNHMGGYTYTSEGLKQVSTQLFMGYKQRKVVVVLTDGLSNYDIQDTIPEAERLKQQNVEVYTVGLTKYIDEDELRGLASFPPSKYFLHLDDPNSFHYKVEVLVYRLCNLPDPTEPTAPPEGPGCQNNCINCGPGKYLRGSQCVECMQHCSVCRGPRYCELCDLNYYWSDQEQKCLLCKVKTDLAILIDNSGSINDKGRDNYNKLKSFLAAFVNTLDIGYNKTRVGALRFSDTSVIEFLLDKYTTEEGINDAIKRMGYEGSHTNIAQAIRAARTQIFGNPGDRPDVSNVALLITDGESTRESNLTAYEAELARRDGIILFVVGVTNEINLDELHSVASKPVKDYYFNATDISALENIFRAILRQVCSRQRKKRSILSVGCDSERDPSCPDTGVDAIASGTNYLLSTSTNFIYQQMSFLVVFSIVLVGLGVTQLSQRLNKN